MSVKCSTGENSPVSELVPNMPGLGIVGRREEHQALSQVLLESLQ